MIGIQPENIKNPNHIYTNISSTIKYTILIGGDFKGLDNSDSINNNNLNYLYMVTSSAIDIKSETQSAKAYQTQYYLQSINTWGNIPIQNLTNFCINASGLIKIPNASLPNVNYCMSAFMNCINLYKCFMDLDTDMNNFMLPVNAIDCSYMFANTNLKCNFSNLNQSPYGISYLTNINHMFYNTNILDINKTFYNTFIQYYNGASDTGKNELSKNYIYAFPNTISSSIDQTEFNKDYFKNVLSPH